MDVYLENALDISIYKPAFSFYGGTVEELIDEIRSYLGILPSKRLILEIFDRRRGCISRVRLFNLPPGLDAVYVVLKLENGDQ
jgi:hypothetical protein